jgi:hypothetical protein
MAADWNLEDNPYTKLRLEGDVKQLEALDKRQISKARFHKH